MTKVALESRYWKAPEPLQRLHALRIALDSIWKLPELWKADEAAGVVRCGSLEVGLEAGLFRANIYRMEPHTYRLFSIIDAQHGIGLPLATFKRLTHSGMDGQERDAFHKRIADLEAEVTRRVELHAADRLESEARIEALKAKIKAMREAERAAR
jgi:hypothetical protein